MTSEQPGEEATGEQANPPTSWINVRTQLRIIVVIELHLKLGPQVHHCLILVHDLHLYDVARLGNPSSE